MTIHLQNRRYYKIEQINYKLGIYTQKLIHRTKNTMNEHKYIQQNKGNLFQIK